MVEGYSDASADVNFSDIAEGLKLHRPENMVDVGTRLIKSMNVPKTVQEYVNAAGHHLSPEGCECLLTHADDLNPIIEELRQTFTVDFMSARMYMDSYLLKDMDAKILEDPVLCYLRTAVQVSTDLSDIVQNLKEHVRQSITHASPTIFNSLTNRAQLASCFLMKIDDDMLSICDSYTVISLISKNNGGVGIDMSDIRHSQISNTGMSKGVAPIIEIIDRVIAYVDQGGKRKGALTFYVRPHHIDFMECLDLMDKHNSTKCTTAKMAVWISDHFEAKSRLQHTEFTRDSTDVNSSKIADHLDGSWWMFCPKKVREIKCETWTPEEQALVAAGINDVYGDTYARVYELIASYLSSLPDGHEMLKYARCMPARDVREAYDRAIAKFSNVFVLNADSINHCSNTEPIGIVRCSNLCTEITEISSGYSIASCNLASINLSQLVENKTFNYDRLGDLTRRLVSNIDNVVDRNNYIDETLEPRLDVVSGKYVRNDTSNRIHDRIKGPNMALRPLGIGVSGFIDAVWKMDLSVCTDIDGARLNPAVADLNKKIFACMYWNALAQSVQLAILRGRHERFEDTKAARGLLQFDLYAEYRKSRVNYAQRHGIDEKTWVWPEQYDTPVDPVDFGTTPFPLFDSDGVVIDVIEPSWSSLKTAVQHHGLRNSLLLCVMPTASTASLCHTTENVQVPDAPVYNHKIKSGRFMRMNAQLYRDLEDCGVLTDDTLDIISRRLMKTRSVVGLHRYLEKTLGIRYDGLTRRRMVHLYRKYLTSYEIRNSVMIELAAQRQRYICQSQSLNLFLTKPDIKKISDMQHYGHYLGLKTLNYYINYQERVRPDTFTDMSSGQPDSPSMTLSQSDMFDTEECEMCSS